MHDLTGRWGFEPRGGTLRGPKREGYAWFETRDTEGRPEVGFTSWAPGAALARSPPRPSL